MLAMLDRETRCRIAIPPRETIRLGRSKGTTPRLSITLPRLKHLQQALLTPSAVGRSTLLTTMVLLGVFWSVPAPAQQFGQWWWDGSFGVRQRSYQNFVDGEKTGSLNERDLRFSLGVNGFVIHPAVARFRVGFEGLFSTYKAAGAGDSDRWGLRGDIRLFPLGKYRIQIFAAKQFHDFSNLPGEGLITLRGTPDTSTSWGGRVRVRAGRLRGTVFGLERSSLGFIEEDSDPEIYEREFVDWSRHNGKLQRHFRLERRMRDFGMVDFKTDNVTANFDQYGDLADSWRWNLFGSAIRQVLSFGEGAGQAHDTARFRNQLIHTTDGDNLVDLSYSAGLSRGARSSLFQSHAVSAYYRWHLRPWQISPFAQFGVQRSKNISQRSPRVGVAAAWNRSGENVELSLTNRISLALIQRSTSAESRNDSQVGLSTGGSFGHGDPSRLQTELEGAWARNEFRFGEEAIIEVPALLVPVVGGGNEDFVRGRVTLRRRWRHYLFSGYSEWSRRERSGDLAGGFSASTLTHTLQVGSSRFNVTANLGEARIRTPDFQDVDFVSIAFFFRPLSILSVRGSHRTDHRTLLLAPDVDGDRMEVGAGLQLGMFIIQINAFLATQRTVSFTERTNRGVTWTLTRQLQGWLPFVTRGPRRGGIH